MVALPVRLALGLLFALGVLALPACTQPAPTPPEPSLPPPPPAPPPPPPKLLPPMNPQTNAGGDPLSDLLGGGRPLPPAEKDALVRKYKSALVGTWTANLGNGVSEELVYTDSTYSAKLSGPMPALASGKYTVAGLVGTKSLKLRLDTATGPRNITVTFEDGELQHPTLQQGVTGTFHKK